MRPKSLILLALALGCGLVASIGISQVMDRNGEQVVGYDTTSIYVALHNINLNDPIDAEMVSLQEWPTDKVPQGAITRLEELENRRPRTAIIAGEPLLEAKLLAQGEVHDPIGEIPPGMRLKTISVDAEKSAAGLLSPGDRVDMQLFVNRNPGAGINVARTRVILQNIRIYAVDQTVQRAADGGEGRTIAKTVSLLLTPDQANKVALAEQIGELNLIPRSPDDEATIVDLEISFDELMGDKSQKNTRRQEQGREENGQKKGGGFFGDLMVAMKRSVEEQPPAVMVILEADEMREVQFDPLTGRPMFDSSDSSSRRRSGGVPAQPASTTSAVQLPNGTHPEAAIELDETDFPIDFNDD